MTTRDELLAELASVCVHDITRWPVLHRQTATCGACGVAVRLHRPAPTAWYGYSLGAVRAATHSAATAYARRHGLTDRAAREQLAADCGFTCGAYVPQHPERNHP
jgi:hypothetical protein